jgi:hypothetical protein
MAGKDEQPPRNGGLNPALRKGTETVHDTTRRTPAPVDSASVQHEEGRPWPLIWLVVTVISVCVAIYLIFF